MGLRGLPIRIEDLALAAWNAAGVPLVTVAGLGPILEFGGPVHPLAGAIQLAAVIGVVVAVATRPPDRGLREPRPAAAATGEARLAFIGPLVGAVAFVAGSASDHLGVEVDGPAIGVTFIAIVAAMLLGDRLPVVSTGVRRALVAPFILVSAGIFDRFAADILVGVDLLSLASASLAEGGGLALFILIMLVGGLAAFYAALVVAPRQLVEPEIGWVWPVRFLLFLASAVFGIGWLAAVSS